MATAIEIGNRGESLVTEWLRERGYLIVARNWRSGRHEIDIVAEREGVLHFVEVKSRNAESWQTPEQAMTRRKSALLVKATNHYVALNRVEEPVQIDLATVVTDFDREPQIELIEQAAYLHW